MSDAREFDLTPAESELAERLGGERAVPPAAFRGALGRWLAERDPGFGPRPERLRPTVAAWIAAGSALIAAGALAGINAF